MPVASPHRAFVAWKIKKRQELQTARLTRYQNDPVAWIEERAKGVMYERMREIARSVAVNRRTAVPSAHEVGKSWLAGRLAAWWIDAHPPGQAFVVTTAPTSKQVKAVLWKEIRRAFVAANLSGRLNQTEWWLEDELVAIGRKPADTDPTAFQGIHAKYVLLILDEACGIPKEIVIAGNSLIANEFGRMFAIGNPDDPDTHFKTICEPDSGWTVIPISAYDTPNFTGEYVPDEVKHVLVSPIYVDEMKKDVGEESGVFKSKVLGQFPENKADGIVPIGWIRKCQNADLDLDEVWNAGPVELGVDVGAGGDDTSIRERRGMYAARAWSAKTPQPEEAFALVIQAILESNATRVKIDVIGLGWGLIGMLQQTIMRGTHYNEIVECEIDISQVTVVGVNVGQSSTDPERFPRLRDQMWWEIGRELSKDKGWDLTLIDDKTVAQLARPTWRPDLANRHKVESKLDTMKRTSTDSPNEADALLLAFCEPPLGDQETLVVIHDPVSIGPSY